MCFYRLVIDIQEKSETKHNVKIKYAKKMATVFCDASRLNPKAIDPLSVLPRTKSVCSKVNKIKTNEWPIHCRLSTLSHLCPCEVCFMTFSIPMKDLGFSLMQLQFLSLSASQQTSSSLRSLPTSQWLLYQLVHLKKEREHCITGHNEVGHRQRTGRRERY